MAKCKRAHTSECCHYCHPSVSDFGEFENNDEALERSLCRVAVLPPKGCLGPQDVAKLIFFGEITKTWRKNIVQTPDLAPLLVQKLRRYHCKAEL